MVDKLNPVGYINQGCYWTSFDSEPTDYVCEYCGSHWTLAYIDGMDSLIKYSMSEAYDYTDYENINTIELFKNMLNDKDELDYYLSTYLNNMRIVIEDYDINVVDFINMSTSYFEEGLELGMF